MLHGGALLCCFSAIGFSACSETSYSDQKSTNKTTKKTDSQKWSAKGRPGMSPGVPPATKQEVAIFLRRTAKLKNVSYKNALDLLLRSMLLADRKTQRRVATKFMFDYELNKETNSYNVYRARYWMRCRRQWKTFKNGDAMATLRLSSPDGKVVQPVFGWFTFRKYKDRWVLAWIGWPHG